MAIQPNRRGDVPPPNEHAHVPPTAKSKEIPSQVQKIISQNIQDIDEKVLNKLDPALLNQIVVIKREKENTEFKPILTEFLEIIKNKPKEYEVTIRILRSFFEKNLLLQSVDISEIKQKHQNLEGLLEKTLITLPPLLLQQLHTRLREIPENSPLLQNLLNLAEAIYDLQVNNISFDELPYQFQENPYIAIAAVKLNHENFEQVSNALKNQVSFATDLVSLIPEMYTELPLPIQRERDVAYAAVSKDPDIYRNLPPLLRSDISLAKEAISKDPYLIRNAPPAVQKHPNIISAYMNSKALSKAEKTDFERRLKAGEENPFFFHQDLDTEPDSD